MSDTASDSKTEAGILEGVSESATVAACETRKPWELCGCSRGTWYRYGKPDPNIVGRLPKRVTQREAIQRAGIRGYGSSVRSWQRYERATRLWPAVQELMAPGLIGSAHFAERVALLEPDFRDGIAATRREADGGRADVDYLSPLAEDRGFPLIKSSST